jgi:hypothetical protein
MLKFLKKSEQVVRKFIRSFSVSNWQIETPDGFKDLSYIHKTVKYEVWKLKTETGKTIKCADDHIVFQENGDEIFVKECIPFNTVIITKDGFEKVTEVSNLGYSKHMYDVTVNTQEQSFYSNDILSHNTTASIGYILHFIIFNPNVRVALLANKGQTARTELLARLQQSFENLPQWLQQGIVSWNKGSLELENGSRVIAAATSSSAIRGGSYNCIAGDSEVTLRKDGKIFNTTMRQLFSSPNSF